VQEVTSEKLQIAYVGPAVELGQISMLALGASLRGQALLIERVKEVIYGDSVQIRVEVDYKFEHGSVIVPVHILTDAIVAGEHLLSGEAGTALANLLTIMGFVTGGVVSLYKLFKKLKGRRIEKAEDIPEEFRIEMLIKLLIRVYNDEEVQKHLRRTLEALHHEGIDAFQTRRQGLVIDSVSKADLRAADEAELEDLTLDEEIELDIEKCAWKQHLAWHFSDGGKSFDAKIEDRNFWIRIEDGESFSGGDRLRVHLQTTAHRSKFGRVKVERVIPRVLSVDHVHNRQRKLFNDEPTIL